MAGFDPNQPRDELGRWSTVRAAKVGAGLAYEVKSSWGDAMGRTATVHKFVGGATISEDFKQAVLAQQEDKQPVRFIYNAETNTWHVSEHEWLDHGDFEEHALEGMDREYIDSKLLRGFYDPKHNEMTIYDFTGAWEAESDWMEPSIVRKNELAFERSAEKIWDNMLQYVYVDGKKNKLKDTWQILE